MINLDFDVELNDKNYVLTSILAILLLCAGTFVYAHPKHGQSDKPHTIDVRYHNGAFFPARVEINRGDSVNFINSSDHPFWPASNIHPAHSVYPEFDPKKPIAAGDSWLFLFDKSGEWRFHNHLASVEGGTVIVRGQLEPAKDIVFVNPDDIHFKKIGKLSREHLKALYKDDEVLTDAIRQYGPAAIVLKLSEYADQLKEDCHQRAHVIGRISYELYGAAAFLLSSHECQSGSYHGSMEALFRERGTRNLAANVEKICSKSRNRFFRHQCIHGVGHGLMAWTNYELIESLALCDRLKKQQAKDSCYSGVFMENVGGGLSGNMGHFSNYISDDPHFPCNILEKKYISACYGFQTSRMIRLFKGDFIELTEACEQAPTYAQISCVNSMGRDVGSYTQGRPLDAIEFCSYFLNSDHRLLCLRGAVQDSFWEVSEANEAINFCRSLSDYWGKRICYKTIIKRSFDLYRDPDQQRTFCDRVEAGFLMRIPVKKLPGYWLAELSRNKQKNQFNNGCFSVVPQLYWAQAYLIKQARKL